MHRVLAIFSKPVMATNRLLQPDDDFDEFIAGEVEELFADFDDERLDAEELLKASRSLVACARAFEAALREMNRRDPLAYQDAAIEQLDQQLLVFASAVIEHWRVRLDLPE